MYATFTNGKIEFHDTLPLSFKGYEVHGIYGFIKAIAYPELHVKQAQDPSYRMPFYMNLYGLDKSAYKEAIECGLVAQEAQKFGDDLEAMRDASAILLAALSE